MNTATPATLAALCTEAVRQYIEACASPDDATLEGLLQTEATNWGAWKTEGHTWGTVRVGLQAAWAAHVSA
jgi:hypothetical protein